MILQAAPLPRRPLPSRAQLLDPKYLLAPGEGMMMRRIFAINIVIFIGFKYVVLLIMMTAYVSKILLPFQAMVNGLVWFFHILPAWLVRTLWLATWPASWLSTTPSRLDHWLTVSPKQIPDGPKKNPSEQPQVWGSILKFQMFKLYMKL